MSEEAVRYEQHGAIVTLTLNRPETRNALADDVVEGLVSACCRLNADLSVACAILTGTGSAFSSGGNVKDMQERKVAPFTGSPAEMRHGYRSGIQRMPLAFHDLEVPVIAAVNGPAVGAGLDLALMCDIRIASEKALFAESFLRVGLISGDGGAWYLPRVIGLSRALEMSYTADPVEADRAVEMGLASRVVPAAILIHEAEALAARISRHPRHSLRLTKRLIRESMKVDLPTALEIAAGMQAIVQHTSDQREAVDAFIQKRQPLFSGT